MFNLLSIRCLVLIQVLLLSSLFPQSSAETKAPEMKSIYTLNFIRFTHWPESEDKAKNDLGICYSAETSVAASIAKTSMQQINGRALQFRQITLPAPVNECDVFFISDSSPQRLRRLLAATLQGLPILLVGDNTGFLKYGGMIELFEQDRKIRFSINLDAIRKSGLRLDAQLLDLAVEVRGQ